MGPAKPTGVAALTRGVASFRRGFSGRGAFQSPAESKKGKSVGGTDEVNSKSVDVDELSPARLVVRMGECRGTQRGKNVALNTCV